MIEGIDEDDPIDHTDIGVRGFDFTTNAPNKKRISFLKLIIHLWPGHWREQLKKINDAIISCNRSQVSLFYHGLFFHICITNIFLL